MPARAASGAQWARVKQAWERPGRVERAAGGGTQGRACSSSLRCISSTFSALLTGESPATAAATLRRPGGAAAARPGRAPAPQNGRVRRLERCQGSGEPEPLRPRWQAHADANRALGRVPARPRCEAAARRAAGGSGDAAERPRRLPVRAEAQQGRLRAAPRGAAPHASAAGEARMERLLAMAEPRGAQQAPGEPLGLFDDASQGGCEQRRCAARARPERRTQPPTTGEGRRRQWRVRPLLASKSRKSVSCRIAARAHASSRHAPPSRPRRGLGVVPRPRTS